MAIFSDDNENKKGRERGGKSTWSIKKKVRGRPVSLFPFLL